jgi:uncharacterized cupredoxin-like copper-binding protein
MLKNESSSPQPENTAQEVAEVIREFEQYRERLMTEAIAAAQKAKLPQKTAMSKIEPELQQIDASLENLRTQLATLRAIN